MNSETLLVRVMKLIVLTFLARYVVWHNHRAIRTDLAMDYHSWHRTSYLWWIAAYLLALDIHLLNHL